MSTTVNCGICGQSYHDGGWHDCPGSDTDRIEKLEARVEELENYVKRLDRERREMWDRIQTLERNT